jgi:hypothetical protein
MPAPGLSGWRRWRRDPGESGVTYPRFPRGQDDRVRAPGELRAPLSRLPERAGRARRPRYRRRGADQGGVSVRGVRDRVLVCANAGPRRAATPLGWWWTEIQLASGAGSIVELFRRSRSSHRCLPSREVPPKAARGKKKPATAKQRAKKGKKGLGRYSPESGRTARRHAEMNQQPPESGANCASLRTIWSAASNSASRVRRFISRSADAWRSRSLRASRS